jgi:Tfp pilus assembly protein PilO
MAATTKEALTELVKIALTIIGTLIFVIMGWMFNELSSQGKAIDRMREDLATVKTTQQMTKERTNRENTAIWENLKDLRQDLKGVNK